MDIRIEGYQNKYLNEVVSCLMRNYAWLAEKGPCETTEWLKPVLEYSWQEDVLMNFPHKYGSVLLDDGSVVGFCGNVYSKRYDENGRPYIFLRPTTWAIDAEYRIYLFKILKQQFKVADVIGDFEPRASVEEALVNLYKFQYCDKTIYKFPAVPHIFSRLRHEFPTSDDKCFDKILSRELLDNEKYGVKAAVFTADAMNRCIIFYQLVGKKGRQRIMVLKVENGRLLAEHAHEIFWALMRHENVYHKLKCDSRFFCGEKINYPIIRCSQSSRLLKVRNKEIVPQLDFLYSDTCMLEG